MSWITLPDLEKHPLRLARWNRRAAVSLLALATVVAGSGYVAQAAAPLRFVAWLVAGWATFSGSFFWLAANAHAEVAPIRFFVQRTALFVLLFPAGIAILTHLDPAIAEQWVVLSVCVLFAGVSVIGRGSWRRSGRQR